jgi:hypothetical protein
MLRFAQHDSPLSFPRMRGNQKGASPRTQGNQKGASPVRGGIRQGLGGFAEFWLGRILDALLRSA